jgi:hypothetical protein
MTQKDDQRRAERVDASGAFLAIGGERLALADLSTMGARTIAPLAGAADGDSLIATLILPGRTKTAASSEHVVPALVVANGARGLIVRYTAIDPKAAKAIGRFLARKP